MELNIPTKLIYLEEEKEISIGRILKENNFNKVLFLFGRNSLKKSGFYDLFVKSLNENEIKYIEFNDVEPNPEVHKAEEILKLCQTENVDCILAVGGGSVLDMAKYVCNNFYYQGDITDLMYEKFKPINTLKLVTCITLIGSGSEMSNSCVMSDKKKKIKQGFRSITNYPYLSYLNPYLTKTCSKYQLAVGVADMFCHTLERYFSLSDNNVSDDISLAVLKQIVEVSKVVINDDFDVRSRKKMMLLGSLAHCGITSFLENYNMPIHKVEHILTGKYDNLTHGEGIAIIMNDFVKLNKNTLKTKIVKLCNVIFNSRAKSLNKCVSMFSDWVCSLNLHTNFDFLSIDEKEVATIYMKFLKLKNK